MSDHTRPARWNIEILEFGMPDFGQVRSGMPAPEPSGALRRGTNVPVHRLGLSLRSGWSLGYAGATGGIHPRDGRVRSA